MVKKCITTKSGEILFVIPNASREIDRMEDLAEQILEMLYKYSNEYECYQKAIEKTQGYLKALILHFPEEKEFIKKTADYAGEIFVRKTDEIKKFALLTTIQRGEMFLQVKNIHGGKNVNNNR